MSGAGGRKGHFSFQLVERFAGVDVGRRAAVVAVGEILGRKNVREVGGRRPNGFQRLSLNGRTILFLEILLDKAVSVG